MRKYLKGEQISESHCLGWKSLSRGHLAQSYQFNMEMRSSTNKYCSIRVVTCPGRPRNRQLVVSRSVAYKTLMSSRPLVPCPVSSPGHNCLIAPGCLPRSGWDWRTGSCRPNVQDAYGFQRLSVLFYIEDYSSQGDQNIQ